MEQCSVSNVRYVVTNIYTAVSVSMFCSRTENGRIKAVETSKGVVECEYFVNRYECAHVPDIS